ncbi:MULTISPECIES: helix-turn-helix domain-containing protein [Streptomyces]|uniref:Helix-turn-helix domain-containing protein n=2 Tax=Streptomyces rochei group TaxID=2867164 RepID=A0ABY6BTT5_9ACTN|nr:MULTISPECIES: helix-turn-helix transcriptional regulator [Streptomyces]PVD11100.1 hypothetical protein DBP22_06185 [Streptomyces sp. CS207]RSS21891.1 XRE family transcriptional regulator [Streptomyces sp. WAC08452]UXI78978.1 helix-turn-helix domain-containing protein [Streptomyces vinaceusdrappus]
MPARSSSRRPFAWAEKTFDENVPPDRRKLAAALQEICRHLTVTAEDGSVLAHPTQAQAAAYLHVSDTTLTRYLQGQRIPPGQTLSLIFDTACRDAGSDQNVGIKWEELRELHARAEQERCGNCSRHREAVRTAGQKLRALQEAHGQLERSMAEREQEIRELRQHVTALKRETQRIRAVQPTPVGEAGPRKFQEAAGAATLLPVPRQEGDRQQSANATVAASHVGRRAEELLRSGRPDSTLALIRHTAEAYAPTEVALLVALLRSQEQGALADNLVHIYARDRHDHDVVRTALLLHERQAVADAEALLRTAAAYPGSALSRTAGSGPPG